MRTGKLVEIQWGGKAKCNKNEVYIEQEEGMIKRCVLCEMQRKQSHRKSQHPERNDHDDHDVMGRIYGSWRPVPKQRSKVERLRAQLPSRSRMPAPIHRRSQKNGNEGNMLLTSPKIHPSFALALTFPRLSVVHPLSQSTTNSTPSTIADT